MSLPFTPRFDVTAPVPPASEFGRTHVLAVGGAGMSAVARLLLDAGVSVSGSDANDSELLRALGTAGVDVHVGHDPSHVTGVDTVVVSSAIRDSNIELATARAAGARVLHRSQALAGLMAGQRRVAVAGANGKTTTTSLLVSALVEAGSDPSFAIGGELVATGVNARLGTGTAFVVEADESDGSFLAYRPDVAVVTNVQPDHLDFYGTFEAVEAAYALFAESGSGALLVTSADDDGAWKLAQSRRAAGAHVVTFGESERADLRLVDVVGAGLSGTARIEIADGAPQPLRASTLQGQTLEVPMPGRHNLHNAAAALLAATLGLGEDEGAILAALARFGGVRRRFEIKGEAAGVRVVDDYAHNAPKVAAVVQAGRQVSAPGRLIVAFQPHLFSRTRDFAEGFATGLAGADEVVLLDIYPAREDPISGVTSDLIAEPLRAAGTPVHQVVGLDAARAELARIVRPGDLVVTVGAGSVTQIGPALLRDLEAAG